MGNAAFVVSIHHIDGSFSKYVVCAIDSCEAKQLVMARQSVGASVAWIRPMSDGDLYEVKA